MESSRAGIGPMSPALTGGSSTTGPPGKPCPKCFLDLGVKAELKGLNYGVRMPLLQSCLCLFLCQAKGFPNGSVGKESACNAGDPGLIPGSGRPLWRRKWQPSPVFLPGKSHGQRSLMGYNPWHHKRVGQDLASKQLNNEVIFPS